MVVPCEQTFRDGAVRWTDDCQPSMTFHCSLILCEQASMDDAVRWSDDCEPSVTFHCSLRIRIITLSSISNTIVRVLFEPLDFSVSLELQ